MLVLTMFVPLIPIDFVPTVKAQESTEGWINRYTYDVDYGNGTHTTTSHIGTQVFWDNTTNEWKQLHACLTNGTARLQQLNMKLKVA